MNQKKKRRDYTGAINTATKELQNSGSKRKDERFWQLSRDKEGGGFAIIRFLPDKNPSAMPFKTVYKHTIDINKKLFIEKCPTTIQKGCPICEWNKSQPSDWVKNEGKTYRKKSYISNILVVSDPANPENEGKIFLFEFGAQVFGKVKDKLSPSYASEEPLIYFHPEEGANFKVKVKKEGGAFATWNGCEFDSKSDIDVFLKKKGTSFDEIEDGLYDLSQVINETDYKTEDEISSKFKRYLLSVGLSAGVENSPDIETHSRKEEAKTYANKKEVASKLMEETSEDDIADGEGSDDGANFAEYFKTLEGGK